MLTWSPQDPAGRSSYRVLVEGAIDTATRVVDSGGGLAAEDTVLLSNFAALNVGGQAVLGQRIAVGGSLPLFLYTISSDLFLDDVGVLGPALGDLVAHGSYTLVSAPLDDGLGVSVIPFVRLPTGASARSLGDAGPGAGAQIAAGYGLPWGRLDVNTGVSYRTPVDLTAQRLGGLAVPIGAAAGVQLGERVWLAGEIRGEISLERQPPALPAGGSNVPVEWMVTLQFRHSDRVSLQGGVGRGLTAAAGTAGVRSLLGFSGFIGQPDGPQEWTITATDPDGVPVPQAAVWVGDDVIQETNLEGSAMLTDLRWRRGVVVRADGFVPTPVSEPESGDLVSVVLPYAPADVVLRVSDEEGASVPATVTLRADDGTEVRGEPGTLSVTPGRYEVTVEAPGAGAQERVLVVPPRSVATDPFEVVLLPEEGSSTLGVRVVDPDDIPVRDARVLIDGRPVGTTADAGVLRVLGVPEGPHVVEVQHPNFTSTVVDDVPTGTTDTVIRLRREQGSVRVTVRNPDGDPVQDGIVRFLGPRRLPPVPLGDDGQRVQVLGPGDWTVLVTSQAFGVQERTVDVPRGGWSLIEVVMVLQPPEEGEAILTLRVVDPEGKPVDAVEVALDGRDLGRTSTGGTIRVPDLAPGLRTLSLSRARMRPMEPVPIVLTAGDQERVVQMDWLPGQVEIRARTATGPVDDGIVRFFGPRTLAPTALGAEGIATFTLDAGPWTLLVASEQLGVQQRTLEIPPDSRSRYVVEFQLSPTEGGLAELLVQVVDPEGAPVDHASVRLDGVDVGATSNTGELTLGQLAAGRRTLEVEAPALRPVRAEVELGSRPLTQTVRMNWAPGAVRLRVRDALGPVPDAVVRLLGPESRRPVLVDEAGEALVHLTPGRWGVLATSEQGGVGEVQFDVPTRAELTDVTVALEATSLGSADLAVRVTDPVGRPVPGAAVEVGDRVRTASEGGLVVVRDLDPGRVALQVLQPGYQPWQLRGVTLPSGLTEQVVQLDWTPAAVVVKTDGADGEPVSARVQPEGGPVDVLAIDTEADGQGRLSLVPGKWRLLATSGAQVGEAAVDIEVAQPSAEVTLQLRESAAQLQGRQVTIVERVQFDFDSAVLRADSEPVLDAVARVIRSNPGIVRIEVQGHTDNIGTVAVNQRLSQQRAASVVEALMARGVAPEKLVPVGYGRSRPLGSNDTADGRAANRRVQFEVREVGSESAE